MPLRVINGSDELHQGAKVGCNALCTPHNTWVLLSQTLKRKDITIVDAPLIEKIWKERPKDERQTIYVRPENIQENLLLVRLLPLGR